MLDGDFFTASGVILRRDLSGEKGMWLKLFLKDAGIVNVTAKKTSGDSEPLLWGKFNLKKKRKTTNYLIDDVEVVDDMLRLRTRREALLMAFRWGGMVAKFLEPGQPDDDLLANLYWSMKLLGEPRVPVGVVNWKFLWRWLEGWGLAPDLVEFYTEQHFKHDEVVLLAKLSMLNANGIWKMFASGRGSNVRERSFKAAASLAEKFLNEK